MPLNNLVLYTTFALYLVCVIKPFMETQKFETGGIKMATAYYQGSQY